MEIGDYMLYVPELNKFYEEITITSFSQKKITLELKEIRGVYFIIENSDNDTKKVIDFNDLSIALTVYHSMLEKHILGDLH